MSLHILGLLKDEASRAIHELNGKKHEGTGLKVAEAHERRLSILHSRKKRNDWKGKPRVQRSQAMDVDEHGSNLHELEHGIAGSNLAAKNVEEREKLYVVHGEVNSDIMGSMARSLIGELCQPLKFELIVEQVKQFWRGIEVVKALSSYTILITFETVDAMDVALSSGSSTTLLVFSSLKIWNVMDWWSFRRVWVERNGVHPYAWSEENLWKIGEQWGMVVNVILNEVNGLSFSSAFILIETCIRCPISGLVFLSSRGSSCDVHV